MEYFQVVIWASEAHFCHRLYNYSYNLQGYWVDVSQQKSVLVESGDVYLIQKPQYKLDLFAIVPTESFCKWNKFDYIPGLKLDSKCTNWTLFSRTPNWQCTSLSTINGLNSKPNMQPLLCSILDMMR